MKTQELATEYQKLLSRHYKDAWCALNFRTPLELLIATILSAQCTDERVNLVTQTLFGKYKTANDYANAALPELEADIRSTGFFRNKAKNIQACCRAIVETHAGKVPETMEELTALRGIGRKTANVILGTAFGKNEGIVVDTHVGRLSQRMGLTKEHDPEKIEQDLMKLFQRKYWTDLAHQLIHHGRRICMARNPNCPACPLAHLCPKIGVKKKP